MIDSSEEPRPAACYPSASPAEVESLEATGTGQPSPSIADDLRALEQLAAKCERDVSIWLDFQNRGRAAALRRVAARLALWEGIVWDGLVPRVENGEYVRVRQP